MKKLLCVLTFSFLNFAMASSPQGNHFSECHPIGQNDRHSFKMTAYFDNGDFYSAFQMFKDEYCEKPSLTIIYGSDFIFGAHDNDLVELDHTPTHVFMVLLDQDVVDFYNDVNRKEGCGIKNWKINFPRDVNGLYCHPYKMPTIGGTLYDLVKYQNNVLQFGGIPFNWNISDPINRPKTVHYLRFKK